MSARGDLVVDLLLGRADGLSTKQICAALGLTINQTRGALEAERDAGRVDMVYLAGGHVVWLLTAPAAKLRDKLRAASHETKSARDRRRVRRDWEPPDMPVVQRRVDSWEPVRVPPGPATVFNWSSHA